VADQLNGKPNGKVVEVLTEGLAKALMLGKFLLGDSEQRGDEVEVLLDGVQR
jgi:hypothetical protein